MSQTELDVLLNYLGGKKLLHITEKPQDFLVFHTSISHGFPAKCAIHFKELTGFTNLEMSKLLGISEKTFVRWQVKPQKLINPVSSDRLFRTAKVMVLAAEVLEDENEARSWMSEPQIGLDNKRPRELLTTEIGARQVEDLLLRMEHGYLA